MSLSNNYLFSSLELNLSAAASPLQIVPHYKTSKGTSTENELKVCFFDSWLDHCSSYSRLWLSSHHKIVFFDAQACGVVRFYNHKHNCYVAAEGSFAGKNCQVGDREIPMPAKDDDEKSKTSNAALDKQTEENAESTEKPSDQVKEEVDAATEDEAVILNDGNLSLLNPDTQYACLQLKVKFIWEATYNYTVL